MSLKERKNKKGQNWRFALEFKLKIKQVIKIELKFRLIMQLAKLSLYERNTARHNLRIKKS